MLRFLNLLLFTIAAFTFSSCAKKDSKISVLNGAYPGTFYYHSPSAAISGQVTVTFSENKYASASNSNRIPAAGNGSYQILNQQIQFTDTNVRTADFDWGLILNGNYTSQIKSDSLILTKITPTSFYQYRLKRTN